jgi:FkbM family methyltransferase
MPPGRSLTVVSILVNDLRSSARHADDARPRFRLGMDCVLSRLIALVPRIQRERVREIRLRGDIKICYRLNKGDLQSIREIWFQEAYCLPFQSSSGALLDLGANIGMASLWLAKKYSFIRVIAVELDPNNAGLVCQNLELKGIASEILETAIGPKEAMARFEFNELSNLGRLSENGSLVRMISVATIIQKCGVTNFALITIDIEGGEQELFDGPRKWLARTDAIIIGFHPTIVDYPRLTTLVSSNGFKYIPAHPFSPENMA